MSTGDPFFCFEHKEYTWTCAYEKHRWETQEEYDKRLEDMAKPTHPECPYCRCTTEASVRWLP